MCLTYSSLSTLVIALEHGFEDGPSQEKVGGGEEQATSNKRCRVVEAKISGDGSKVATALFQRFYQKKTKKNQKEKLIETKKKI